MTDTLEDLQIELTQVKAAISAAYSGAEYEIESGGSRRKLKRQSLELLLERKSELEMLISVAQGNGRNNVSHGLFR